MVFDCLVNLDLRADPTLRFSDRVADYIKYRPRYPFALVDFLKKKLGLLPSHCVADVGSGTGISSQLFLENGNKVYGVEPNAKMRKAATRLLVSYSNYEAISGTAEQTHLEAQSVDIVFVAQAFHWMDPKKTKEEFHRILKPGGKIYLVWNKRRVVGNPFLEAYEALILKFAVDYEKVRHSNLDRGTTLREFFAPRLCKNETFNQYQSLDFTALLGRLRSSSYTPSPSEPIYQKMVSALGELFTKYERDGEVSIEYDTTLYYGALN